MTDAAAQALARAREAAEALDDALRAWRVAFGLDEDDDEFDWLYEHPARQVYDHLDAAVYDPLIEHPEADEHRRWFQRTITRLERNRHPMRALTPAQRSVMHTEYHRRRR